MTESKSFNRVATIILTFLVIVTLLPIVLLVIASFTKEQVLVQNGYTFFPKALSLDAYYYMVKQGAVIVRSYGVSFLVTVLGTVMSVVVTTTLAYPMARKSFRYKNVLSFFVFFYDAVQRRYRSVLYYVEPFLPHQEYALGADHSQLYGDGV